MFIQTWQQRNVIKIIGQQQLNCHGQIARKSFLSSQSGRNIFRRTQDRKCHNVEISIVYIFKMNYLIKLNLYNQ